MAKDVRIVVVAYHSAELVKNLLRSLDEKLQVSSEIIVWDNGGSSDTLRDWSELKKIKHTVVLAGDGKNLGFARAVNRAVQLDTGRAWNDLLLLNPDAELASPLTHEHVQEMQNLGGVCGFAVFNDKALQSRQASARMFPTYATSVTGREGLLTKFWPNNPWSKNYLQHNLDFEKIQQVDWVSGCALYASKKTWQKLGGFDESYFLYVEDVDLGRKAQAMKIPVYYYPKVSVVHAIGGTVKSSWKSDFYHHAGMWVYHIKWGGLPALISGPFVFTGIWLRYLLRRVL